MKTWWVINERDDYNDYEINVDDSLAPWQMVDDLIDELNGLPDGVFYWELYNILEDKAWKLSNKIGERRAVDWLFKRLIEYEVIA